MTFPLPTRKKPSPWMARSSGLPVCWIAPAPIWLSIAPSWTPRPICIGFVPPNETDGAEEPRWSWYSVSLKAVVWPLKPTVLTFAMSFAATSSMVWLTCSPLIAENIPLIISCASLSDGSGDDGAVDVREHLLAHVLAIDRRDHGLVGDGYDESGVVDEDERA